MRPSRVFTIAFAAALVAFALFAVATVGAQTDQPGPGTGIEQSSGRVTLDGRSIPVDVIVVPAEVIGLTGPGIGVAAPVPEVTVVAVPEGFSWTDAGIGAAVAVGGMVVLLLLAGAALSLRWHEPPWHWHHGATT